VKAFKGIRYCLLGCCILVLLRPHPAVAQQNADAAKANDQPYAEARDGQHDFRFEIGSWKIHRKRLVHPLTGSTTWVEFDGTVVARKLWDGRANLDELQADSPTGHIEGLTLRL
jgi:hypothetical protein